MHGRHHVGGDREHLDADEQHDQVIGRHHDGAACSRHEHEQVQLGAIDVLAEQVAVAQKRHERHGETDHRNGEQREPVHSDRPGDRRDGALSRVADSVPQRNRRQERRQGDHHRVAGRHMVRHLATQQGDDRQTEQGPEEQDHHRSQIAPRHVGQHQLGSGSPGLGRRREATTGNLLEQRREHQWPPSPETVRSALALGVASAGAAVLAPARSS